MQLEDLRRNCRLYEQQTGYDTSLRRFRDRVGPEVRIQDPDHRQAILDWLNDWGCRQFAIAHHNSASQSLLEWAEVWMPRLPQAAARLDQLSPEELDVAEAAYADLFNRHASTRQLKGGPSRVTFGPAGAAKTLFILRPEIFAPWDKETREGLQRQFGVGSYRSYLQHVLAQLQSLAEEAGTDVQDLPRVLDRPSSTPPKLIDEYYWIVFTRGLSAD
jgi:hypothetical protein